jgi:large subunit ribosomal protein L25
VKALPQDMPEAIDVDVTKLDLGKSFKISQLKTENYSILNLPRVTIATVSIPRALKGGADMGDAEGDEGETDAEGAEEGTEEATQE